MTQTPGNLQRQISLPLREAVIIAIKSIRVRLFRSMLSTAGIILAIAFLMFIWSSDTFEARLTEVSGDEQLTNLLETRGATEEQDAESIRQQKQWLAAASLILCAVGIVNSMLMAVTERFREIGTMKCLGALDSLILKLFVLESMFQGLAGTVLGAIIGFALSLYIMFARYGSFIFKYFPTKGLFEVLGLTIAVGVGLTVAAALYPAFRAARMQPVEAMRVEE